MEYTHSFTAKNTQMIIFSKFISKTNMCLDILNNTLCLILKFDNILLKIVYSCCN